MLKKVLVVILAGIILSAGAFFALNYLGIDVLSGLTKTAKTSAADTETALDAARFEPDIAFAPNPDGFGFRNYSKRYPEGNLTIEEARDMFGDVVCTRLENDKCIPHPKVLTWLNDMNEIMNGTGHCIGFTVASHQLQTKFLSVNELGADQTYALNRDVPVLRTISRGYSSYYASNVFTQEVRDTPSKIVDALMLLDEPVDIGIYYPKYGQNGHSILGYDVVDKGDGIYHVLVYDNNHPGEDNVIVVDTNKDTWFYAEGAVNPDQPAGNYQGDADTKSLSFIPLSAYNQSLACPADFAELCPSTAEKSFSVLTIFGRGKALAETSDGLIGQSGDTLVNTVPDNRFLPVRGELFSRQMPIMLLPATDAFSLQAQGSQANEPLSISVANPSLSVKIDHLVAQPEQIERLNFDPTASQVAFIAGGPQQPSFEFIFTQNGVEYQVQLTGLKLDAGQDLTVNVDTANGNFIVTSNGQTIPKAVLVITRLTPDGEATFASSNLTISSGATHLLELDKWDGVGPMSLLLDDNNDGVYSKSTLTNEPVAEVLPAIGTSEKIFSNLQHLAPYLDGKQTGAVATTLPTLNFTAEQLGSTYLALPGLQPDDLAGTLAGLNLPPKELAQFAVARRFDEAKTSSLLDDLGLPGNKRTAVEDAMKDQRTLLDVLDDWSFLNPDDPAAALPTFIADKGLPDELASDFRTRVAPPQEVAQLQPTPTDTPAPTPTATSVPPTDTPIPPTPTATSAPPTSTPIPPTPTATSIPPTNTPVPTPTITKTPPVVSASPTPESISFEQFGSWKRGDQPYGTFTQSTNPVKEGSFAGKLEYDFSTATSADDFVVFTHPIAASGKPGSVQIWVYGDGSGHFLNIWIEDANGEVWSVPTGTITYTGWKQATGVIDANAPWPGGHVYGPDNGTIDYPIRFLGLVVDRIDGPKTGTLSFDNITFSTGAPLATPTAASVPSTGTPATTPTSSPVVASDPLAGACSTDGGESNDITFVNATNDNVTGIWIDWDCIESGRWTLAPGESHTEHTYTTHPWHVRSETTGEYLPMETPLGFVLTYINDTPGSNVTVTIRQ